MSSKESKNSVGSKGLEGQSDTADISPFSPEGELLKNEMVYAHMLGLTVPQQSGKIRKQLLNGLDPSIVNGSWSTDPNGRGLDFSQG